MIKRYFINIIIIISLYTLSAQNYVWPTAAGRQLSSTFGEYRPEHFHAGIDIKTNYTTGYPVFAIDNGYIWRVRTSPFGYGKAIYLKLDDGNMAVYGHLDTFIRPIAAYVKSEQMLKESYSTDIYFKENDLRISRGDSIAYTGSSGTKYPHLHFETRDKNNQLVNPLNTNLRINDPTIPTIKSIALVPIAINSRINGLPSTQIFNAEYIHKRLFRIDKAIVVTGKVAIEIKAHDTARGAPNKYNPYGIELFVDDSLYFHSQYDLFDFAETRMVNIDRNYQLYQDGAGIFNRLWAYNPNSNLPFYTKSPGDGILNLPLGNHAITINVFDHNGNTSTLNFTLVADANFRPLQEKTDTIQSGHCISFTNITTDSLAVSASWVYKTGSFLRTVEIDSFRQDSTKLRVYVPHQNYQSNEVLKITLINQKNMLARSYFIKLSSDENIESMSPEQRYINQSRTFLCEITFSDTPQSQPLFFIQTAEDLLEFQTTALSPIKYLTDPIPRTLFDKILAFEWRYNQSPRKIYRVPGDFNRILPGSVQVLTTPDSLMTIVFNENSVYDTLINWIEKSDLEKLETSNIISIPYSIHPRGQALKSDILVKYNMPASENNLEQLGLYQWDEGEWDYIEEQQQSALLKKTAQLKELGTIALLRDSEPPLITAVFPGNGGRFRSAGISAISATIKDLLSGIQDDHAITVSLDGQILYAEYNAPKDFIRYKLSQRLENGQHTLIISAHDRAKNSTTVTSTFSVY